MFGPDLARRYPSFAAYLHECARDPGEWRIYLPAIATWIPGIALFSVGMATSQPWLAAAVVPFGAAAATLAVRAHLRRSAEIRRREEARGVAKVATGLVHSRRLHRVLDEVSLSVIEEGAACWARVRRALDAPHWNLAELPPVYAAARGSARAAADAAMDEILLLYRAELRNGVESPAGGDWSWLEDLAGVFGAKVRARRDPVRPSEAVWPARDLVDRLRMLASEAERIAREAPTAEPTSTDRLEAALGDLRAIRAAEEELREKA